MPNPARSTRRSGRRSVGPVDDGLVITVDELAAGFGVERQEVAVAKRPDPPANPVTRLEDGDLGAAPGQLAGGNESGKARADNHHPATAQGRCFSGRRRGWGGQDDRGRCGWELG